MDRITPQETQDLLEGIARSLNLRGAGNRRDWKASPWREDEGYHAGLGYIRSGDVRLSMRHGQPRPGRVSFGGYLPNVLVGHGVKTPHITVSADKTAEQIAGDVAARLIPKAIEAHDQGQAARDALVYGHNCAQIEVAQIRETLDAAGIETREPYWECPHSRQDEAQYAEVRAYINKPNGGTIYGKLTVSADRVNLDIQGLTPAMARQMLAALGVAK